MTQTHVISALVDKRAELGGQISSKQAEIKGLKEVLLHLDRTIKVFSPEFDLRTIKATRTNTRNALFARGEIQRMVLNHMRCATDTVIGREIADEILRIKGIEANAEIAAQTQKNVLTVLRRLERKGLVCTVSKPDGLLHWQIA